MSSSSVAVNVAGTFAATSMTAIPSASVVASGPLPRMRTTAPPSGAPVERSVVHAYNPPASENASSPMAVDCTQVSVGRFDQ